MSDKEVLQQTMDFLKELAAWEAGIILDDKCWSESDGPYIIDEHHDKMLELQNMRNDLIDAIGRALAEKE